MNNTDTTQGTKKELELWRSRDINFHLYSKYPQVLSLVDSLLDEVIAHIKHRDNPKRIHTDKYRDSLSLALLNLYSFYQVNPKRYIAYSRNPGGFQRTRYKRHNIGYDVFIKKVINSLDELGYIESHLGFHDKDFGIGMNSRMKANLSLIELFDEHKLAPVMVQREAVEEVIILKSVSILKDNKKDKYVVDYEDTEQTNKMRENLQTINALLDSRWIDLNVSDEVYEKIAEETEKKKNRSDIDFTRKKLKRVFNNKSFEDGGRFYHSWWLDIPKRFRKNITIDGKRTVEVDYSSIHFRILYAEQGIDIRDKDPYIIEGYEDRRRLIKIALNIILNAETKKSSINAIHSKLKVSKDTAIDIYKRLEEEHPKIKQYFGSGRGVKLQYIDSKIAEQVMLNLARDNIVCLPVHDSFIVRLSHQIDLHEEMDKAFKEIAGVDAKREMKKTVLKDNDYRKQQAKLYQGEETVEGTEGVIIKGSNINYEQMDKLSKKYGGYHLREGQWIEHKGYI
ncbi:MAG: hypothetical protein NZ811_00395 [Gammaproteobacteria bacterium]|nr:hypothetical protein [Gammaproteobacteria bacterium]